MDQNTKLNLTGTEQEDMDNVFMDFHICVSSTVIEW